MVSLSKTGVILACLFASGLLAPTVYAQQLTASTPANERQRLQQCQRRMRSPLARGLLGLLVSRDGLDAYDAIERRLIDACERERAAIARRRAVELAEQGQADQSVTWTSPTRRDVSGSATASTIAVEARGRECLTVTNIIVVSGQETRVPRRMCRTPPSHRFVEVRS